MSVIEWLAESKHEQVSFFHDKKTNLTAIVAVHDTTLGPALGGCRMKPYESFEKAAFDVLHLSEAMSYKNSLAGLNLGGGKSVIIADSNLKDGRAELFQSFGRAVQSLCGRYITAEDMGTSVDDMSMIVKTCEYVAGRDPNSGGAGDPSPYTARGVFDGIRACLERTFDSADYSGRHVAIQGVGHTGGILVKHLVEAGAQVTVADTNTAAVEAIRDQYGVDAVAPNEIASVDCDVFAPCAVGQIVNPESVKDMRCQIIAGAANNQIDGDQTPQMLSERGILYAPDFAINAGGVILCADELEPGGFTPSRVKERVDRIYHTVGRILDEAKQSGKFSGDIAVLHAQERIEAARA